MERVAPVIVEDYQKTFRGETRYIDNLGGGFFGIVDLHKIIDTQEEVAVKNVLPKDGNIDGSALKELNSMQQLIKCPNIVQLLGVETVNVRNNTILRFMMPYYEYDLTHYIRYTTYVDRIKYFDAIQEQMFGALNNLYYRGIIHSDIKPDNILIDTSGSAPVAYLADFGLSVQLPCEINYRKVKNEVGGSPIFMAPELLTGHYYLNDKIDVWSLGITLVMYFVMKEFTYPTDDWIDDYDTGVAVVFQLLSLLTKPKSDTMQNFNLVKQNLIDDHINVFYVMNQMLSTQHAKMINRQQIDLLNSMLQMNPDKRLSIPNNVKNAKVCPRIKHELERGPLKSLDLKKFYELVYKMIYISEENGLQITTCYSAINLFERYASNYEVLRPEALAAACLIIMAKFYDNEYLTFNSMRSFYYDNTKQGNILGASLNLNTIKNNINAMEIDVLEKTNYIITSCDMDEVLHALVDVNYSNLYNMFKAIEKEGLYSGDMFPFEIVEFIS